MEIGKYLYRADVICDYVPVISTVSTIVNLFQKFFVIPYLNRDYVNSSYYYSYLNQKSTNRCISLLVPIIGNIIVGIFDFKYRNYNNENFMREATQQNI